MSRQSFVRGFVKKAEECGADPAALAGTVKTAQAASWLKSVNDYLSGAWNKIDPEYRPLVGGLVGGAGGAGLGALSGKLFGFCKAASEAGVDPVLLAKYAQAADKGSLLDMLADDFSMPGGLMAARREQILNEIADSGGEASPRAHAISEWAGALTSTLAAHGLGKGIGAALGNADLGGMIGSGAAGAANLVAAIAAAVKRRRTREEQIENDKGSILKRLLVPGVAVYDGFKRTGRAYQENKDRIAERAARSKGDK